MDKRDEIRMKLWVDVYESTLPGQRIDNADQAVDAFDEKFPEPPAMPNLPPPR